MLMPYFSRSEQRVTVHPRNRTHEKCMQLVQPRVHELVVFFKRHFVEPNNILVQDP